MDSQMTDKLYTQAQLDRELIVKLRDIGDALRTTNLIRGREIHQLADDLQRATALALDEAVAKQRQQIVTQLHLYSSRLEGNTDDQIYQEALKIYNAGFELAHELQKCGHSRGDCRDPNYIPGVSVESECKCIGCQREAEQVARASSKCPICGKDTPHNHSRPEINEWLDGQASRFGMHNFSVPTELLWQQINDLPHDGYDNVRLTDVLKCFNREKAQAALSRRDRQVRDELIQRHRCDCEVCAHSAELCPASKSSIALESTSLERRDAEQRLEALEETSLHYYDDSVGGAVFESWLEDRIAALRKQVGK
jgi:hypothetical protein